MEHQSNNTKGSSGANTVLIVFVIILLVGFGIWWYLDQKAMEKDNANDTGIDIQVDMPKDSQNGQ